MKIRSFAVLAVAAALVCSTSSAFAGVAVGVSVVAPAAFVPAVPVYLPPPPPAVVVAAPVVAVPAVVAQPAYVIGPPPVVVRAGYWVPPVRAAVVVR